MNIPQPAFQNILDFCYDPMKDLVKYRKDQCLSPLMKVMERLRDKQTFDGVTIDMPPSMIRFYLLRKPVSLRRSLDL